MKCNKKNENTRKITTLVSDKNEYLKPGCGPVISITAYNMHETMKK
jgi:hypothetical protein